jgi:hypothetical protein
MQCDPSHTSTTTPTPAPIRLAHHIHAYNYDVCVTHARTFTHTYILCFSCVNVVKKWLKFNAALLVGNPDMFSAVRVLFEAGSTAADAEKWRVMVCKLFDKAETTVRNAGVPDFVALFPQENNTPTTPRLLTGPEQIELVEKSLSAVRSSYTHMMDIDVQQLAEEVSELFDFV